MASWLLTGCSPKYFAVPDLLAQVESYRPPDSDPIQPGVPYRMTLQPRVFYKNNVEETALLSDNSRFLKSGQLMLLDSVDIANPRWHEFTAWIAPCAHGPDCTQMHEGQSVVFVSGKGHTVHQKKSYELLTIYYGKVGEGVLAESAEVKRSRPADRATVRFFHEVRLIGNRDQIKEAKVKDRDPKLVGVVQRHPHRMTLYALVDQRQNNIGGEKSTIFEFSQIYGEDLWLMRLDEETSDP